jgi:uncharacterized protein (DUF2235 family)
MNFVFCADGTWNDPMDRTNVYKLFSALEGGLEEPRDHERGVDRYRYRESPEQKAFYVEGVGAHGTANNLLAGATGFGLHSRVLDGYLLLSREYKPGDKIYVFGFSRGAFVARSLAGMIAAAGLMDKDEASSHKAREHANMVWGAIKLGRRPDPLTGPDKDDEAPIELVGVWDTVGALGVPAFNGISVFDRLEKKLFDFADLSLSKRVRHGRHAMAIDSRRRDFAPTPWDARERIKQIWFAGVHSDVGGGYAETGLSDVTLEWMLAEAEELGLRLKAGWRDSLNPNPVADRHESFVGPVWEIRGAEFRSIPADADFHESVATRFEGREDYRPEALRNHAQFSALYPAAPVAEQVVATKDHEESRTLDVGESVQVDVQAKQWWNSAQLHVGAGEKYHVEAIGTWTDWHNETDADGYERFTINWLKWSRRVVDSPWFHLVAAIHPDQRLEGDTASILKALAHEVGAKDAQSQLVPVGKSGDVDVADEGFLYFFANDAAGTYGNNFGVVTVTVTRVT